MDDLIYHIFSYFLLPVIQFRYSLVCKHWYELTNCEKFYKNYHTYVVDKGLHELIHPKQHPTVQGNGDHSLVDSVIMMVKKYLFDWTEFVSHLYPREYEILRKMRHSIYTIQPLKECSDDEFQHLFSQLPSRKGNRLKDFVATLRGATLITMDNGSGKRVSFFADSKSSHEVNYYAFVNDKYEMLDQDSEEATHFKTCLLSYTFYDYGWGDSEEFRTAEGHEWFCEQFPFYIEELGNSLFLTLMEFLCHNYDVKRNLNYVCERQYEISKYAIGYKDHPMLEKARKIHYFLQNESHFFTMVMHRRRSNPHLWYRLLYSGYQMNAEALGSVTFQNSTMDVAHLQFFYDYCEMHEWKECLAIPLTQKYFYSILSKGKEMLQVVHRNGGLDQYPQEICTPCVCSERTLYIPDYELLDYYVKEIRQDMNCPFDDRVVIGNPHATLGSTNSTATTLTNDLIKCERTPQRLLILYPEKHSKQHLEHFLHLMEQDMSCCQHLNTYSTTEQRIYTIEEQILTKRFFKGKKDKMKLRNRIIQHFDVIFYFVGTEEKIGSKNPFVLEWFHF
ncbi:hypothetical protein FDP41_007571 [Naegleria fowleri]|uniref:F-box domain-containing protein n=1 Tax=Naegleria fowleri TaxID=5763 RepID=A0A6A5C7C7_NAEFO|nr:uncharacterized protein FDP41_007571 [Naegleria fowleri]KAF0983656.1 hypothetical protein FDP41_007571 [Naegleria fowleri]